MKFAVKANESGLRVDVFVFHCLKTSSRKQIKELFIHDLVRINGKKAVKGQSVSDGDLVEILPADAPDPVLPDVSVHFKILFEDGMIAVVEKPAGVPTHPNKCGETGTLANGLAARWPFITGVGTKPLEPGLVHRLDNGTSGLMVVALENRSFAGLRRMFSSGKVEKTYTAVVEGSPPESGSVKFPIAHDPGNRRKMIVLKGTRSRRRGKAWPASTRFVVVSRRQGCSLVELGMDGGVMHQIRVHMSCIGHPVVGDSLYGSKMGSGMGGGFFLHASGLSFRHPVSGVRMEFHSPVPSAFGLFLSEKRRKDS